MVLGACPQALVGAPGRYRLPLTRAHPCSHLIFYRVGRHLSALRVEAMHKTSMACPSLGLIHPIIWLGVARVVNLLRGVEGGVEVLKQGAALLAHAIDEHLIPAGRAPCSGHDEAGRLFPELQQVLEAACHVANSRSRCTSSSELAAQHSCLCAKAAGSAATGATRAHAESTFWLERPFGCILVFLDMLPARGALGSNVLLGLGMPTSTLPF